jgi:hypothetical protein
MKSQKIFGNIKFILFILIDASYLHNTGTWQRGSRRPETSWKPPATKILLVFVSLFFELIEAYLQVAELK